MPVSKRLRIANAQHCEWLRGAEHVSGAEIGDGARSGPKIEWAGAKRWAGWNSHSKSAPSSELAAALRNRDRRHFITVITCIWGLISHYKMCMCSLSLMNAERERSQECRQLTLTPWRLALPGSSQGYVSVSRQSRKLTTSRAISCRLSRRFVRRARSVAQYSRRRPIQTNLP